MNMSLTMEVFLNLWIPKNIQDIDGCLDEVFSIVQNAALENLPYHVHVHAKPQLLIQAYNSSF